MAAKKSGAGKIILIIFAVVGGVGVLGCLLCGGGGYFMFNAGMSIVSDAVIDGVESDPNIQEQLGGLDELSMDLMGTADAQKQYGSDALAFKASGPNGEGQIVIVQSGNKQGFEEGYLITDEGEWEIDVSGIRIE